MIGDKYAILSELKDRLKTSDTVQDSRLTAALETASRACEDITGRQFNADGVVSQRRYRPDNLWRLDVDDFVDNTGLIVEVNGAPWTEDVQFELEPLNGVVDGRTGWPVETIVATAGINFYPIIPRTANVKVTANWGWRAVPDQVHEATLIAAEEIAFLKDVPFGIGGYGDFGIIKARQNPFVCRLLDRFVRYPILAV
jgi:hypothetical protein